MTPEPTPRLSVLMPARNAGRFLDEAIESILTQTERDLELVVVNDGSTDDTGERLQGWAGRDRRCRVFQAAGLGPAGALNVALAEARGALLARMDADDISLPRRLERQRALFERQDRLVVAGTWARTFGDAGAHTWRHPTEDGGLRARLVFDSPLVHPTVMMRRSAINGLGTVYRPEFGRAEDYDLWERLQHVGAMANLPEVHLRYRTHAAQVTVTSRSDSVAGAAQVRKRLLATWWPECTEADHRWHHAFSAELVPPTAATLDQAEAWLGRLDAHHRHRPLAPAGAWRQVVASKWWEICRHCRGLGPPAFWRFLRSPLGGWTAVPPRRVLRLAVESLRPGREEARR